MLTGRESRGYPGLDMVQFMDFRKSFAQWSHRATAERIHAKATGAGPLTIIGLHLAKPASSVVTRALSRANNPLPAGPTWARFTLKPIWIHGPISKPIGPVKRCPGPPRFSHHGH